MGVFVNHTLSEARHRNPDREEVDGADFELLSFVADGIPHASVLFPARPDHRCMGRRRLLKARAH